MKSARCGREFHVLRGRRAPGMPAPKLDVRVDGRRARLFDADFDGQEAEQGTRNFELRLPVSAGDHEIAAGFLTELAYSEAGGATDTNDFSVDYVLVEGPYDPTGVGDTASRRRIFVCRPATVEDEAPCARRIMSSLARRAGFAISARWP